MKNLKIKFKSIYKIVISIIFGIIILASFSAVNAEENSITLNAPLTNDVDHTFKYPNIEISNDIKPYSITLSIENGYFNTNNVELNNEVSTYFDFRGGTNTANDFISDLVTTENYKVITFNLKSTVDLTDNAIKENVIKSIKNFLSDILFYNAENKDAKFTLTFSEIELKLSSVDAGIDNIDLIAFKDPAQPKEHYYARIDAPYIEWDDAYNIAAGLKFNGLQGYLVTITSEAEHNFIYQSLGSIKGWMGAASIENYDTITYNTKNISWAPTTSILMPSAGYNTPESNETNDGLFEKYWHWVAGPEAGQKVFEAGKYTNFKFGEPNNFESNEWCGEYGHGENGIWNDYPNIAGDIDGYYIEFGGFEDDLETTAPVSLINTFKWKDYDFRNIEQNITESLDETEFDENVTEEAIEEILENAITESGVSEVNTVIKNLVINDSTLSFDVEITIGSGAEQTTYTIHIDKEIEITVVEEEKPEVQEEINNTVEEAPKTNNPKTGDTIIYFFGLLLISACGMIIAYKKNK